MHSMTNVFIFLSFLSVGLKFLLLVSFHIKTKHIPVLLKHLIILLSHRIRRRHHKTHAIYILLLCNLKFYAWICFSVSKLSIMKRVGCFMTTNGTHPKGWEPKGTWLASFSFHNLDVIIEKYRELLSNVR